MDKFAQATSYVKICGVTSIEDAHIVIDAGADALGLILAESSRQLTLAQAREIALATEGLVLRVGVFRHNSPDFVVEHVDATGVEVAQIHGNLNQELVKALRERNVAIVKALAIDDPEFFTFNEIIVDAVLIDGPSPGSGRSHAWDTLQRRHFDRPVIAAGGLTALNVGEVLNVTNAWGVDVSSGVESGPRKKDPARVRDFVMNARRHFEQRGELRG